MSWWAYWREMKSCVRQPFFVLWFVYLVGMSVGRFAQARSSSSPWSSLWALGLGFGLGVLVAPFVTMLLRRWATWRYLRLAPDLCACFPYPGPDIIFNFSKGGPPRCGSCGKPIGPDRRVSGE